jgi:hypothetical protein
MQDILLSFQETKSNCERMLEESETALRRLENDRILVRRESIDDVQTLSMNQA